LKCSTETFPTGGMTRAASLSYATLPFASFLVLLVVPLLSLLLVVSDTSISEARPLENFVSQENQARRELIVALNLFNALCLDDSQLAAFEASLEKLESLDTQMKQETVELDKELAPHLDRVLQQVMVGHTPDDEIAKGFHKVEGEFMDVFRCYMDEKNAAASSFYNSLTPNQRVMLDNYVPCVIPTKDLVDPERIGQVSNEGPALEALERMRSAPEFVLKTRKEEFLSRIIEKERKGGVKIADEEMERERLWGFVEEARGMSDVDWELKKKELASKIVPAPKKMKDMAPGFGDPTRRVDVLLVPGMYEVVKARRAAKKNE
jgi:hypothetical protein